MLVIVNITVIVIIIVIIHLYLFINITLYLIKGDLEKSKAMQEEMILAAEEFYQSLGIFSYLSLLYMLIQSI